LSVPQYRRFVLNASQFRELISGRRQGLLAAIARAALAAAEVPYSAAVGWRNRRYDNPRRAERVGAVVVSVGNLTLGGTGKTPLVEWLARWFSSRGVRVALVSRGYGAKSGRPNDEALELAQSLPDVPHLQNPDRLQAARRAIDEFGAQLILLDDGFQHRRLARDLDIVLVDALEPLGFGHVFPRGTLREPLSGWARAQAILLSRADLVPPEERERIRREVARHAPRAVWAELCTRPRRLLNSRGVEQHVSALVGQSLAAFCGIGNPAGFRQQLLNCGYRIGALRELADHQAYPPALLRELAEWAVGTGCAAAICTRKDLVKIPRDRLGEMPLWALAIGLEVTSGLDELSALLAPLAARAGAQAKAC
jgi:tetraacyldisaccharide 4'-kinase